MARARVRRIRELSILVAVCTAAAPAAADSAEKDAPILVLPVQPEAPPMNAAPFVVVVDSPAPAPSPARASGTHHFLELTAGASLERGTGPATVAIAGIGGKVPRSPWRLYVLGALAFGASSSDGLAASTRTAATDAIEYAEGSVGLRAYLPLLPRVRAFGDALVGLAATRAELDRVGALPLVGESLGVSASLALGLQYRIHDPLALGVRVAVRAGDDPLEPVRARMELARGVPVAMTAGLTWHF